MLSRLTIRNVVLIEQAEIPFGAGVCVLTGETGAGKSILLDALGLVLGGRGESRLVRHGADQAVVTAEFDARAHAGVQALLAEHGIPAEHPLMVRRVLPHDGGGRAFVNGEAVGVGVLRALGEMLVEIHGQHDQRGLMDASTHALALDRYGRLEAQRQAVAAAHAQWRAAQAQLEQLRGAIEAAKRDEEYLRHTADELGKLNPQAGEEQELAEARTRMMQNEKLASLLNECMGGLTEGDKSAQTLVRDVHRVLARSALNTEGRFDAVLEALDAAMHQLGLAEDALQVLADGAEYQPAQLERMEERLFALKAAARKYQTSADGLAAVLADAREKLQHLARQDHALNAAEVACTQARAAFVAAAETLHASRVPVAEALRGAIHGELAQLKMAATQFFVEMEALPESQWHAGGMHAVRFAVATNAGSAAGPLGKIASGGELSRLMLALKVILADVQAASTLIFDEIDTGTGGATADAIGGRLAALGRTHQVMVVTHLPQVAAKGAHHFRIEKSERDGTTHTQVTVLDDAARIREIARMLSGADITPEALRVAEQMLQISAEASAAPAPKSRSKKASGASA